MPAQVWRQHCLLKHIGKCSGCCAEWAAGWTGSKAIAGLQTAQLHDRLCQSLLTQMSIRNYSRLGGRRTRLLWVSGAGSPPLRSPRTKVGGTQTQHRLGGCCRCKANYTYSTAEGRCLEECGSGRQVQYPAPYEKVRTTHGVCVLAALLPLGREGRVELTLPHCGLQVCSARCPPTLPVNINSTACGNTAGTRNQVTDI